MTCLSPHRNLRLFLSSVLGIGQAGITATFYVLLNLAGRPKDGHDPESNTCPVSLRSARLDRLENSGSRNSAGVHCIVVAIRVDEI